VFGGLGLRSLIGLSPSAGSVSAGAGSVKYSMEECWHVRVGHVIGIVVIAWLKVVGSVGVCALGGTNGGGAGGATGAVVTWGW